MLALYGSCSVVSGLYGLAVTSLLGYFFCGGADFRKMGRRSQMPTAIATDAILAVVGVLRRVSICGHTDANRTDVPLLFVSCGFRSGPTIGAVLSANYDKGQQIILISTGTWVISKLIAMPNIPLTY